MNYCFGVDIGGTTVKIGLFEDPRDRSRSSGACDGRRNCKRERKSRMEI